ncbi:MAG: GNAT family N-acetyltransferase [Betaproteobacteria bacterium]
MTDSELSFRKAERSDLAQLIRLLADDPLGSRRERFETPLPGSYLEAFNAIAADPNNELVVACVEGRVVGMLQLTFIFYLTYQGGWRALVEGVRIDASVRSLGLGKALLQWAINRARERRCHMVQLTTDKTRPEVMRFYEALGFEATHEGMKLHLTVHGAS